MNLETEIDRINPNPRIVALIDYAIVQVNSRLPKGQYADWREWAASWLAENHSPADCVDISHRVSKSGDSDPVGSCLGQIAWGAKEACYSTPTSGWLVIRYIADAMIWFGIAFPEDDLGKLLETRTIDLRLPMTSTEIER